MISNYDNIIFDLDGTLIDSSLDIINCLVKAYEKAGIHNVRINKSHIGPKIETLINQLTPEIGNINQQKVIKIYRDEYDNLKEKQTILYEGVIDTLHSLKSANKNLFIATNKPKSATIPLLNHFEISFLFKDVLTPTSIEKLELNKTKMIEYLISKYYLDISKTIMVGDHADDIYSAKINGISSIAVLYGYSSAESMKSTPANFKINHITEILIND